MPNFGVTHLAWLKTWLALPNGIPSPDTIPRLLSRLDPAKIEDCWTLDAAFREDYARNPDFRAKILLYL